MNSPLSPDDMNKLNLSLKDKKKYFFVKNDSNLLKISPNGK